MSTQPVRSPVAAAAAAGFIPLRTLAIEEMRAELARGVKEVTPNWSPRIREYALNCDPPINVAAPWCAMTIQFVTDVVARRHSLRNPLDDVKLEAYCPSYAAWAKAIADRVVTAAQAEPGDLVVFNFGGKRFDHIAMLNAPIRKNKVVTIDGNSNDAGSREGEKMVEKTRPYNAARTLLVRWDEGLGIYAARASKAA